MKKLQKSQIKMTATKRRLRRDANKDRGNIRDLDIETLQFLAPLRQDAKDELKRRAAN